MVLPIALQGSNALSGRASLRRTDTKVDASALWEKRGDDCMTATRMPYRHSAKPSIQAEQRELSRPSRPWRSHLIWALVQQIHSGIDPSRLPNLFDVTSNADQSGTSATTFASQNSHAISIWLFHVETVPWIGNSLLARLGSRQG